MSTQSPRAHKPASRWIWCTDCGHRGYHTRSDAKAVRKHHRGKGLTIFTCPHRTGDETDLFHLGHQPVALGRGRVDRRRITADKRTAHTHRTIGTQPTPSAVSDAQEREL